MEGPADSLFDSGKCFCSTKLNFILTLYCSHKLLCRNQIIRLEFHFLRVFILRNSVFSLVLFSRSGYNICVDVYTYADWLWPFKKAVVTAAGQTVSFLQEYDHLHNAVFTVSLKISTMINAKIAKLFGKLIFAKKLRLAQKRKKSK